MRSASLCFSALLSVLALGQTARTDKPNPGSDAPRFQGAWRVLSVTTPGPTALGSRFVSGVRTRLGS
jgi:hypothetical protein